MGIPKVIHYCWFGRKQLPKDAVDCIESWKKYYPDYEIVEWNEDNFNVNICDYVKEAYAEKSGPLFPTMQGFGFCITMVGCTLILMLK